jgi:branched-chain amino acid transport system substrate-binding protein
VALNGAFEETGAADPGVRRRGSGEPGTGAPIAALPPALGARLPLLLIGGAAVALVFASLRLLPGHPATQLAQAPAAAPPTLAESRMRGITASEIRFGMAAPFTGPNRELGRAMRAGIEAAFAAANEAGGVHGRRLRLLPADDGYEPARTSEVMKQLVERDEVFAVVGNVGTPTAAVSIPYCLERKVIFFGALSGGDLLRRRPPDRYVFNVRPSYAEETAAAVRWLVKVRRIAPARIAVFAQEDAFGESGFRGASEELSARGVDPARILRVGYRRNTADVADAVATLKARARELDAVVMVATYKAAAAFVRALREAGLRFVVTNVSAVDTNALAEELVTSGRPYAEGVMVTQIVPLPTSRAPGVVRFQDAMALHAKGERPGFLALEGFVVAQVLAEGLRRAGRELDTEKLVAALESIKALDLGLGTTISFAADDHQGSRKVWGTLLQADGTWKSIDLE